MLKPAARKKSSEVLNLPDSVIGFCLSESFAKYDAVRERQWVKLWLRAEPASTLMDALNAAQSVPIHCKCVNAKKP